MLLHSLQRFQERQDVGMVVCVLPREQVADPPPWIFQSDLDRLLLSVGGATRAESVRNGLEDMPASLSCILVHDAARPLAPAEVIDRVVRRTRDGCVAIPVLPVADTIKEVGADSVVLRTVDRSHLVRVQTPQGFPRDVLIRAHANALARGTVATDDAALAEQIGARVCVVQGSDLAMKITTEADFAIAETLLRRGSDPA
jgi:2-C-methyl-D-erythritol 4-phosphate cytidylyltransferase